MNHWSHTVFYMKNIKYNAPSAKKDHEPLTLPSYSVRVFVVYSSEPSLPSGTDLNETLCSAVDTQIKYKSV